MAWNFAWVAAKSWLSLLISVMWPQWQTKHIPRGEDESWRPKWGASQDQWISGRSLWRSPCSPPMPLTGRGGWRAMSSRLLLKPKAQLLAGTSAASLSLTWALAGAARLSGVSRPQPAAQSWRWAAAICPVAQQTQREAGEAVAAGQGVSERQGSLSQGY